MKTFYWIPREGMQSSVTPAVQTVKFGDGYEQRRPAGLNFILKNFKPVFRVTSEEERQALEDFLFDHAGVKAFLWRPPKHNRTIKIVCREWSVTDYACYTDFNCTFEQVVI
ncbi:phage tail protein [Salmonella enterica]|uniref:Phage tail protein n=3 Tax=Salmonella enterica TaxID=28901 RepID=A0A5Z8G8M2_SALER|nr:phage tail protein [Salmonella enterica]EAO6001884.1 phage tail protein [Salmonella enterica subsp. arizonae serovar 62:z36:-]EBP3423668.1 phage tail protein [Salmonella enterica subsp. enterica]EBS6454022.1 phage tail protein [Salmonella enterica subsp. enterica serovar Offa]ECB1218918.1 phage tail protein [Salmonella enterica subsp. enterica serovar Newport]ECG1414300.1 phage tail protein [Salmonella enterica subsp. arizonae str. CFSAN000560]ECH6351971.1 phage tail protein [Salmonella en